MQIVIEIDELSYEATLMLAKAGEGSAADIAVANGTPLPKGQKLYTPDEVWSAIVEHGQHDSQFKLGEIIKYSPSDVKKILETDKEVNTDE